MEQTAINREDYEEPCCPFTTPDSITPIPVRRVMEKLDEYLGRNDDDAAERHLRYWLNDAVRSGDKSGQLSVLNEQIGLYRKTARETEGIAGARAALALARQMGLEGTVTMGTTLINAATAYKAFDHAEEAMPLYREARDIYEATLSPDDSRLGGLYNNMALTVMAFGNFAEARELFNKAMTVMEKAENGELEMAITYCNLADLAVAERGETEAEAAVGESLGKALSLLNTAHLPRDGYYAFVCEKCAPVFGYYGYFSDERELTKRAEDIYDRA